MREIKFRAWDKYKKEMIMPNTIGCEIIFIDETGDFGVGRFDCNEDWYDDIEIMQYTGLKDKNGKDIYEGDIVKYKDEILQVYWYKEFCKFLINRTTNGATNGYEMFTLRCSEEVEVIGNIYENPELKGDK